MNFTVSRRVGRNYSRVFFVNFLNTNGSALTHGINAVFGHQFVSASHLIIHQYNGSIARVFRARNRSHFHRLRASTLHSLRDRHDLLISYKNNVIRAPIGVRLVRRVNAYICLRNSFKSSVHRVHHSSAHPSFHSPRRTTHLFRRHHPLCHRTTSVALSVHGGSFRSISCLYTRVLLRHKLL